MSYKLYKIDKQINITGFYTAFESYYSSDYTFEGEAHDFWEIMYIKKGRTRVSADERIYELGEGEMIFHKPMEFHKFVKLGDEDLNFFIFSFSVKGSGMKQFENAVLELSHEQKYAFSDIIYFVREHEKATYKVRTVSHLEDENSADFLAILKNMLELFFMRDLKNTAKEIKSLSTSEALIFKKAVKMMHSEVSQNLSAEDFARSCNVSLSYLKKIFAKHAGIGIHEYFLNLKISEATKLLKDGHTVTETAEMLAFSSQNYFSTTYKRMTGTSPNKVK
ncbi:MAG: AraC family transcriptional regulator [Clostridia bacterium]|nr:AraC family transcriptional regulator [Clostridia bacterium]